MKAATMTDARAAAAARRVGEAGAAFERGARDDAARLASEALGLAAAHAHASQILALCDAQAGDAIGAIALLERAVRLDPGAAQLHYNLAVMLQQTGQIEAAMLEYAATLRLDPRHPGALWNQANLLRAEERFDVALGLLDRLAAVAPDYPGHALATAICLYGLRRLDAASAWFRRANPAGAAGDPLAAWETAHCVLATGDWAGGFDLYERRFDAGDRTGVVCYPFPFPRWRGEPLAGRAILVHGEQGLGDEIMFANALPEILAEAAHVTIVTTPALVPLFQQSFQAARVLPMARRVDNVWLAAPPAWSGALGRIDYQVPIGSLGALRRRTEAAFPAHSGYLRAAPARIERWRAWLDALAPRSPGTPRIGLVWGANPARHDARGSRRGAKKSVPPRLFERLAGLGQFVSLQNRDAAFGASAAPALDPIDCHREILDLADTAALVAAMDVVVSVDTSVLHLAGALGKPALALLPWDCDFRWGHAGERTLWYPAMRLLRQPVAGDWGPVVDAAAAALAALSPSSRPVARA